MTQHFAQHWALLAAGAIALMVVLFVLVRLVRDSGRGRLAAAVAELRTKEEAARKAARRARQAARKLERLKTRADATKPRVIEEAEGSLQDANALRKIADDQVLVARTSVREIIHGEFPPKRQAALRRRLLREDAVKDQPFTMGA